MKLGRQIFYVMVYGISLIMAELLALSGCFWPELSGYAPMGLLVLGFVVFCNWKAMDRLWVELQRWCHYILLGYDGLAAFLILRPFISSQSWGNLWMDVLVAVQVALIGFRFWMMKKYMA